MYPSTFLYTSNNRLDHHDAIVVENGAIVYIGSNEGALAFERPNTL